MAVPHQNIVKYMHGFIEEATRRGPIASIYLEYCDRGNLSDFLKNMRGSLAEEMVWDLFMQLVNGVAFIQYGVRDACSGKEKPGPWIGVVHRKETSEISSPSQSR